METLKNKITLNLDGNAQVNVKGFIAPFEYTQSNFHETWDELVNIRAAEPEKQYPASVFQAFLPSEPVSVGDCWQIQEEAALTLLRQLSPHPQLELHINSGDPQRAMWACLRAYNAECAEILFRIHGQFVMNRGWLTPSQFAGHLFIDRLQEKVTTFTLHVPQTTLNFDIGWTQEDGNTYADIGYCPQVELSAAHHRTMPNSQRRLRKKKPNAHCLRAFTSFSKLTGYRWKKPWRWHPHNRSRSMLSQ